MEKVNKTKYDHFIENNLEAYRLFHFIENMLRVTIVNNLSIKDPLWYKTRLPGDISVKYKEGRKITMSNRWSRQIFHHPIYYFDFPDLKKIISSQNNWDDTFKQYFNKKEILIGYLESLEFTRNNVAHNRLVNYDEVKHLQDIFNQIKNALKIEDGDLQKFLDSSLNKNPIKILKELLIETDVAYDEVIKIKKLTKLNVYKVVKNEWWFDSDYLNNNIDDIKGYFNLVETYLNFTWERGTGHLIESWVKASKIISLYKSAIKQLNTIINS